MSYSANTKRYSDMQFRRCGDSGLKLPVLSLGLWHNFGVEDSLKTCRKMLHTAFDNGITHFDLANNYGPPAGGAETTFGILFNKDFRAYRDEIIVSTKAGWKMWDGPYGDLGSKKYLIASLDQSLKRMGLDYVDIFYHHRPDPETNLEETMHALHLLVQQGKALYIGISGYDPVQTQAAKDMLASMGTRLLIHQPRYSLLHRDIEKGLLSTVEKNKLGCIVFSTLAQGLLTDKYLDGIPENSRVGRKLENGAISSASLTPSILAKVKALNMIAKQRGQSLAQMAIVWALRDELVTSVIVGASKSSQLVELLQSLQNQHFSDTEISQIDEITNAAN